MTLATCINPTCQREYDWQTTEDSDVDATFDSRSPRGYCSARCRHEATTPECPGCGAEGEAPGYCDECKAAGPAGR